ncbi:polyprotein [Glycine max]|nr:polyprotein [Glycine max]
MEIFLWNQMKAKILENVIIMSRLLRSFSHISFRSNSSSSSSSRYSNLLSDQDNQTQEVTPKHNLFDEEVRFEDINQNMDDWNIPEIPQDQLYVPETIKDKHNFDYIIKIVENNIPLGQDIGEEFHLLSKNSIYEHSCKYKYLHIDCVQVAIKPLIDIGIDATVLMCLRDIRHNKFEDSLIGTVETSLGQGPIYFNCYPNKTVSLMDRNILDSLFLNIHFHGLDMKEGSISAALIYRIQYKVMNTCASRVLLQPQKGETTLFITDMTKANVSLKRIIKWDEVTLPEKWIMEKATPSDPRPAPIIEKIKQDNSGKVEITFNRRNSFSSRIEASRSEYGPASRSFSVRTRSIPVGLTRSESHNQFPTVNLQGLDTTSSIPRTTYNQEQEDDQKSIQSPTYSSMEPYDETLRKDFYSSENEPQRRWFFQHYKGTNRKQIKDKFYKFVERVKINILFFDWFHAYAIRKDIDYPWKQDIIGDPTTNVITNWKIKDGELIQSELPPATQYQLPNVKDSNNKPVMAIPFKTKDVNEEVTSKDIKSLMEQANYTNKYLQALGETIKTKVVPKQKSIEEASPSIPIEKPLFKPFKVSEKAKRKIRELRKTKSLIEGVGDNHSELPNKIGSLLKVIPETPQTSENTSKMVTRSTSKLINIVTKTQIGSISEKNINPINSKYWKTPSKLYYQRPTAPDLLLEERGENNFKSFSANNIYEWNIDAQTEYNIMNTLQHMTMVATAYQTSHECSEETIIDILTDLNGKVITNDDDKEILDAVNTLIFTIAQHFIGDPSLWKDRSAELLSNLKCRTLADFRWYRDTFLTRVYTREDTGLPRSLGDKVRDKIRSQSANGDIPYESLSYGQLISYVQKVALKICQDDKIQRQLAKEKAQTKKDLGSFCEQFGLPACPKQKKKQSSRKEIHENKPVNKRFPKKRYSHKPSTKTSEEEAEASSSMLSDEKLNLIQQDDQLSSKDDDDGQINTLTREQDLLFEAINSIPDPQEKKGHQPRLPQSNLSHPLRNLSNRQLPNKYRPTMHSQLKPFKPFKTWMEPEFWDKNPFKATAKAFPPGFHYKPTTILKTRTFYELILVDSNLVSIKHFKDLKDQTLNTHSTIQILKVFQPKHFGSDLNKGKRFSVPFDLVGYTYWDYVDAWIKVFWHQNTRFKHSWLIYFKTNTIYDFPNWFLQWWDFFGPIPEIFPKTVQQGFAQFERQNNLQESRIPTDLKYFSSFALSWIFSWQYHYSKTEKTNQYPSLQRHAFVKWWSQFDSSKADPEQVKLSFQSHPEFLKAVDPETSVFLNQKSHLAVFLARSKSKEIQTKNLKEVLQMLQQEEEGSSSKKEETSSAEEEEEDPFYQNKDDCFVSINFYFPTLFSLPPLILCGSAAASETLRKDFYSPENEPQRRWFFQHYKGTNRKQIQDKFYEFVERVKINVLFFDWFHAYAIRKDIDYPWKQDQRSAE